jgi:hypothetical protein
MLNSSLRKIIFSPLAIKRPSSKTCPTEGSSMPADQWKGEKRSVELTDAGNPVSRRIR